MLSLPFTVRFLPPSKKKASSSVRVNSMLEQGRIRLDQDFLVMEVHQELGNQSVLLVDNNGALMSVPFSMIKFTGIYAGQPLQVGDQTITGDLLTHVAKVEENITVTPSTKKVAQKKGPSSEEPTDYSNS